MFLTYSNIKLSSMYNVDLLMNQKIENGRLSYKAICCLDIFKPHKAQKLKFPCTYQICPSPSGKAPHLANCPISRTRCTLLCPQYKCFHFYASLQNHSNKPITSSHRYLRSLHHLITTKPASHSPYLFSLLPSTMQCCIASYFKKNKQMN